MALPQHPADMRAQMALAMDNLQAVLDAAGMTLSDVVRLSLYSTGVDQTLANFDIPGARFGAAASATALVICCKRVESLAKPPAAMAMNDRRSEQHAALCLAPVLR